MVGQFILEFLLNSLPLVFLTIFLIFGALGTSYFLLSIFKPRSMKIKIR